MTITAAALQAALDPTELSMRVEQSFVDDATLQIWFIKGGIDVCSRCRWVSTVASGNAATQAATVLAAMQEG